MQAKSRRPGTKRRGYVLLYKEKQFSSDRAKECVKALDGLSTDHGGCGMPVEGRDFSQLQGSSSDGRRGRVERGRAC